ncbi:hypothetical protein HA399_07670 [Cobetia sp. UIB-001]|uniref:hypothetical protein n=1 Tax=Cobetia sp. UIB-001 TaxID=2717697 RepID=UPI00384D30EA
MNVLGIRVEPKQTSFVVVHLDGGGFKIVNSEVIKVPAALDFPEKLKYIRNCVLDILREYSVSSAGIRVAEANSQNLDMTRLHIEGVIQEAFSSSSVNNYFIGRKISIAARLKIKPKEIEAIIKGECEFESIINWEVLSKKSSREAALVAMGAVA